MIANSSSTISVDALVFDAYGTACSPAKVRRWRNSGAASSSSIRGCKA